MYSINQNHSVTASNRYIFRYETTLEMLRANAGLNFKLIQFLSRLLNTTEHDFDFVEPGEYINFASHTGSGLLKASENAEMEFEGKEKVKLPKIRKQFKKKP